MTQTSTTPISLDHLTRRTVRTWWADGLWDFAVTGFMLLLAGWLYYLVRVIAFPTWTWPWPFTTDEVVNPRQTEIMLYSLAIIPISAAYMWATFRLVTLLKSRWLASRQGDVRHSFWLKVPPSTYAAYLISYLGYFVAIAALINGVTGGARLFSAALIAAPAAVLVIFGIAYSLPRYWLAGALGGLTCLALELLAATNADPMAGPRGFFDVSPEMGNPAIPALVWAAAFLISGIAGLSAVLRKPPLEQQP